MLTQSTGSIMLQAALAIRWIAGKRRDAEIIRQATAAWSDRRSA
jgi:hypothetical protein